MNRKMTGVLSMLAVGAFAFSVSAFCPDEKGAKTVSKEGKGGCCGSHATTVADGEKAEGGCRHGDESRVDAVMASLPAIQYKVGDQVIGCPHAASAMAKERGKPMQYVVGDDTFSDEGEANVKLASILEAKLEEMEAVQFAVGGDCVKCPVTAKSLAQEKKAEIAYRVAGIDFKDQEKAEKAVALVTDAVKEVKMTYKVDGESFCCDKMAGVKVKESGKPMTFVVGDQETPCDKQAKVLFAQAKIHAAVAAAAQLAS